MNKSKRRSLVILCSIIICYTTLYFAQRKLVGQEEQFSSTQDLIDRNSEVFVDETYGQTQSTRPSTEDIGIILRTGNAVEHRVKASLSTWLHRRTTENLIIMSDKRSRIDDWEVHDSLASIVKLDSKTIRDSSIWKDYLALSEVRNTTVEENIDYGAYTHGRSSVVFRVVPAVKNGYDKLLAKKEFQWYLIVDDDTFVDLDSLAHLIIGYNPQDFYLIGKRFKNIESEKINVGLEWVHGGSGMLISATAMKHLFQTNADRLPDIYERSLKARYGDEHLSMAFRDVGVSVNRSLTESFQGRSPWQLLFTTNLLCKGIISWHHLSYEEMAIIQQLKDKRKELPWRKGHLAADVIGSNLGFQSSWSFNLVTEEERTDHTREVEKGIVTGFHGDDVPGLDATRCARLCTDSETCLAWSFIELEEMCFLSDWFRLGIAMNGTVSGVHVESFRTTMEDCSP